MPVHTVELLLTCLFKQHVTRHQAAIDGGSVTVDGQTATVEARKGPRGRTPRTAQPTQPQGTSSSIYIRAVEPGVTREDVAGLFAPYGSVLNTQLRDSVNGRRYAFVQFESAEIVASIVNSGPFTLGGRTIDVEERQSIPRQQRQPREEGDSSQYNNNNQHQDKSNNNERSTSKNRDRKNRNKNRDRRE
eukprot:16008-Heterococcus_DN1.PRE.3